MKLTPKIEQLIGEYKSILLAKNHLSKLRQRIEEEREELEMLQVILEKEYNDLQELEKFSTKTLFHYILRNQKKQYEIEQQEYLHAVLKLKECKKTIELLSFEEQVLAEKVEREKSIQTQLNHLLVQRNTAIDQKYAGLKNQLLGINTQMDQKLGYKREIYQALIVGLKATDLFNLMIEHLAKAKNVEQWGVNTIVQEQIRNINNSNIDRAQELSYQVKQLLQELEDELEDVYAFNSIKRLNKFEEFRHFNDIYYDRLISDWMVQSKIVSSISYLRGTKDSLKRIVETLKVQLKTTDHAIDYLRNRKKELLIAQAKK